MWVWVQEEVRISVCVLHQVVVQNAPPSPPHTTLVLPAQTLTVVLVVTLPLTTTTPTLLSTAWAGTMRVVPCCPVTITITAVTTTTTVHPLVIAATATSLPPIMPRYLFQHVAVKITCLHPPSLAVVLVAVVVVSHRHHPKCTPKPQPHSKLLSKRFWDT